MLKYKDLTPEQKKYICNGCGGKGGIIKPPNFIFKNHHDFKFWLGHLLEHFYKANKDFYNMMKADISEIEFYNDGMKWYQKAISISKSSAKKAYYHAWAYAYYQSVNIGGKKYFYFASQKKTLNDLELEMMMNAIKKDNKEVQ